MSQARMVNGVPSAEAPGLGLKGKGVSWTFVYCQGSLLAWGLSGSFIATPLSSKESRAVSWPSDVSFASGCWLGTAPRCKPLPAPCIFSGSVMRERRDSQRYLSGSLVPYASLLPRASLCSRKRCLPRSQTSVFPRRLLLERSCSESDLWVARLWKQWWQLVRPVPVSGLWCHTSRVTGREPVP